MPDKTEHEFDVNHLRKITDEMIVAITSPPFVEAMRKLRNTPENKRLAEGARLLQPDALRAAGVPLPKDMRISSRYFEPGNKSSFVVGDLSPIKGMENSGVFGNIGPLGIGGCACGGGLSFCGGAGGSS